MIIAKNIFCVLLNHISLIYLREKNIMTQKLHMRMGNKAQKAVILEI